MRRRRVLSYLSLLPFAAALSLKKAAGVGQAGSAAAINTPAHHLPDGTFCNSDGLALNKPFYHLIKWRMQAPPENILSFTPAQNSPAFLRDNAAAPTLTWVGHSTLLLQLGGVNILTDPQFSQRASPMSFMGPERGTPPGIDFDALPRIDVVLLSHNHYDHFDADTLRRLQAAHRPRFIAPLKLGRLLYDEVGEDAQVTEVDWGDEVEASAGKQYTVSPPAGEAAVDSADAAGKQYTVSPAGAADSAGAVKIIAEPSYHWSARGVFDRNTTLWANYVIQTPGYRFLFIGDTGYSGDYAALGEKYGGFDFAAIPIGAYEPRWFMKMVHINPAEAAQIFTDLKAKRALGVHWGVFQLTDEPMDEPPQKLAEALRAAGIDKARFMVWQHGESRRLDSMERIT